MHKLFPKSFEFIVNVALNQINKQQAYQINSHFLETTFEQYHISKTGCSFINCDLATFLNKSNDFLRNKNINNNSKEYFSKLLDRKNNWDLVRLTHTSNYDFLATLIILKHIIRDRTICNINDYINNILQQVHADFFEIVTGRYDDEYTNNETVISFNPLNFSYKLIEDEDFMTRFFSHKRVGEEIIDIILAEHFEEYKFLLENKSFLELTWITPELFKKLKHKTEYYDLFNINKPKTLNQIITLLNNNGALLEFLPVEMRSTFEIVFAAVSNDYEAYSFAAENLKEDPQIINLVLRKGGLRLLSDEIRNNPVFAKISIIAEPKSMKYAGPAVKSDKSLITHYLIHRTKFDPEIIPDSFFNDDNFIINILYIRPEFVKWVIDKRPDLLNNDETCKLVLNNDGSQIQYLPEEKKNNFELVTIAIKNNIEYLQFAGEQIKKDKKFMLELISKNPVAYLYCHENLREDEDVAFCVMSKTPLAYFDIPDKQKNNPQIWNLLRKNIFIKEKIQSIKWERIDLGENYNRNFIENVFDTDD